MNGMIPEEQHHRRSYRLRGASYGAAGAYMLTICSYQRQCVFSAIKDNGTLTLFDIGKIIDEEWRRIEAVRENVIVDEYVIMPNHVHGILLLTDGSNISIERQFGGNPGQTISSIMSQTKSAVTKRVWGLSEWKDKKIWQPRFHDRILRDERELYNARMYIRNNPLQWAEDQENPNRHNRL
jgi:putative transposase